MIYRPCQRCGTQTARPSGYCSPACYWATKPRCLTIHADGTNWCVGPLGHTTGRHEWTMLRRTEPLFARDAADRCQDIYGSQKPFRSKWNGLRCVLMAGHGGAHCPGRMEYELVEDLEPT